MQQAERKQQTKLNQMKGNYIKRKTVLIEKEMKEDLINKGFN